MKQYYCIFHNKWHTKETLKEKCLKNKCIKKGAKYKKCKHLIIVKEDLNNDK